MSKDDDGLVVEIDPRQLDMRLEPETERKAKTKADDEIEVEAPAAKDEGKSGADDAIAALQKQLDALKEENNRTRAAYEAKSREADEALNNAQSATGHVLQSKYDLVNTEIANDKARAEAIKRELKVARETGNTDLESDLMVENARIGVKLQTNEQRKREIEVAHEREKQRRETPRQPADPVEAAIQGLSPKSQSWLRQHPECITDDVLNAKVLLADKKAKRKGLSVDTPEYFAFIEEDMGYRKPADDDGDEVETRQSDRSERRPAYAAPPSRDTVPGSPRKASQMRLSREQVETAEALGMTPSQYAAWLVKADKDGKYVNH
jgi:hypothetical protein